MEKSDISTYAKSDRYYLEKIGEFVQANRIAQRKTQEELSQAAGINRTTLGQLEKGQPVNLLSLVQVLRALKALHIFQDIETKPQISPLKQAAVEQKQIQRVRHKARQGKANPKSDW